MVTTTDGKDETTWLLLKKQQQQSINRTTATTRPSTLALQSLFVEPSSSLTAVEQPEKDDVKEDVTTAPPTTISSLSCIGTTIMGSAVFLLYQVVFCLAQAATISTAVDTMAVTGVLAKLSALGVLFTGPVLIYELGDAVPALYPASDLFLAPFLAQIAEQLNTVVTTVLLNDNDNYKNPYGTTSLSTLFISTFITVTALSFLLSGLLCICASRIKLANLGLFLPYSVLCGFFTTIGILLWTLGFNVDTGRKISDVLKDVGAILLQRQPDDNNNTAFEIVSTAFIHHIPSLGIGIIMHMAGNQHPFYVVFCILMTILGSYFIMWITNTSLEEATELNWFYSVTEFSTTSSTTTAIPSSSSMTSDVIFANMNHTDTTIIPMAASIMNQSLLSWWSALLSLSTSCWNAIVSSSSSFGGPAMPFGMWVAIYRGNVLWEAVMACIPQIISLAVLYTIRCSLHSAALKKNIPNVTRSKNHSLQHQEGNSDQPNDNNDVNFHEDNVTEGYIPISTLPTPKKANGNATVTNDIAKKKAKEKEILSLNYMLEHGYGYTQIVSAIVGGITISPSVAASVTLFQLGAEGVHPQYGSCILMIFFYVTDFRLVQYIPKPALSCLMVLASINMCRTWLVGSYLKTKDKIEWLVVPLLVIMAFTVGMLSAIVIGICASTFIFVANFYKAGTVKLVGTGLTLRSTVERGLVEASWLDIHADLIQILVLQNYLFFGNIQSVSLYVVTMFDDDDICTDNSNKTSGARQGGFVPEENHAVEYELPPKPKYLILDFTLVTGMDTSAVDFFHEIIDLCKQHQCNLLLAGLSPSLRSMLTYAGIKPVTSRQNNTKTPSPGGRIMFLPDLESALAKAEDGLISIEYHWKEKDEYEKSLRERHYRECNGDDDGFVYALRKIDEQHKLNTVTDLIGLREYSEAIELHTGEVLLRDHDTGNHGIYFVETGLLRVQVSQNATNTISILSRGANSSFGRYNDVVGRVTNNNAALCSIGHLRARTSTIGRQAALWKEEKLRQMMKNEPVGIGEQEFRSARIGQGWVIGSIETSSNGMSRPGIHIAVTDCRLHYLPYDVIVQLEQRNPALTLHLYKLLSLLATKRQEATIHQLAQFVKIMSNPVPRLRGGKRDLARISLQHF